MRPQIIVLVLLALPTLGSTDSLQEARATCAYFADMALTLWDEAPDTYEYIATGKFFIDELVERHGPNPTSEEINLQLFAEAVYLQTWAAATDDVPGHSEQERRRMFVESSRRACLSLLVE